MKTKKALQGVTRRDALRLLGGCAASTTLEPGILSQTPTQRKGLSARGYRRISYDVHDLAVSRDFYSKMFGLKVALEEEERCVLEFGTPVNALYLRRLKSANDKARLINLAFSLANYDSPQVEAELKQRGLSPRSDGRYAWAIRDPNGITLHICSEQEEFGERAASIESPTSYPEPRFQVLGVSYVVIRTEDIAGSSDFYVDLLGMKNIYEDENKCFLSFGPSDNHLCLRKLEPSAPKPYIETFAFTIADFDLTKTQHSLQQEGLTPTPDSPYGWTVADPDGHPFSISRAGLLDFIARHCHGDATMCAG